MDIVPCGDSAFNRASFSLKTLEYLAAGKAVVATDRPAIGWLQTDLIAVASEPGPFAHQVDRLLDQPRTPALMAHRRAFTAEHSRARRATAIYDAVSGPVAPAGREAPPARVQRDTLAARRWRAGTPAHTSCAGMS